MKFIGIGTFAIALSVSSMFVLSLKMTIGAFCSQHFASCSWQCPTASETTNVIWEMEAICWHQSLAARIAVNRDINPVPVVMGEDTRGVLSLLTSAPRRAVLTEKLSSGVLQVGPMMAEKLWQAGWKNDCGANYPEDFLSDETCQTITPASINLPRTTHHNLHFQRQSRGMISNAGHRSVIPWGRCHQRDSTDQRDHLWVVGVRVIRITSW